jgi:hypothetical protein
LRESCFGIGEWTIELLVEVLRVIFVKVRRKMLLID